MTERNNSGGIGLAGILTIIFVVAKITGYLNWSWWWVFSPLWIGFAIVIGIMLSIVICAVLGIGFAGVLDYFDRS